MPHVVILGGGTGGTIVANQMARQLGPELRAGTVTITVISDSPDHVYQPLFLYLCIWPNKNGQFGHRFSPVWPLRIPHFGH